MLLHRSILVTAGLALVASLSIVCSEEAPGPEIVSCTDQGADVLDEDDFYTLCETTGGPPGPGRISTTEYQDRDDDNVGDFDLPFTFTFYGSDYDTVGIDTNGNLWMGAGAGHGYEFDLWEPLNELGDYPVITAWNLDLSSEFYGKGARAQALENPNRVVFEWQTETYNDGDSNILNRFQIVLYETGEIIFHYLTFANDVDCDDYGSGISVGDDTDYLDLSDALGGAVCAVAEDRSFMFEPKPAPMM